MTKPHLDALATIIADVVAPAADEVDRAGAFPRAAVTALGEAGLLGLISSAEVGGGGQSLAGAAPVIEQLARACGSTAMVVLMHYAATAIIEAHGPTDVREEIAAGRCLATLAFSEVGSRSHFWAPMSTATPPTTARRLRPARRPQELGDGGRRGRRLRVVEPAGGGRRAHDHVAGALRRPRAEGRRPVRRPGPAGQRLPAGRRPRA